MSESEFVKAVQEAIERLFDDASISNSARVQDLRNGLGVIRRQLNVMRRYPERKPETETDH